MAEINFPPKAYEELGLGIIEAGDVTNYTQKLIKTRKPHECNTCDKTIEPGTKAVLSTFIVEDEGFSSLYTCIKCCEDWLAESKQCLEYMLTCSTCPKKDCSEKDEENYG